MALGLARYFILQVINTLKLCGAWDLGEYGGDCPVGKNGGRPVEVISGDFSPSPDSSTLFKSFLNANAMRDHQSSRVYLINCDRITQAGSTGRAHLHNPHFLRL